MPKLALVMLALTVLLAGCGGSQVQVHLRHPLDGRRLLHAKR
jgi:hypothetical protein